MNLIWITDALLSFVCFSTFLKLWQHNSATAKLGSIALLFLSIASLFGTLRFALNIETESWIFIHNQTSRLFGIAGLYILFFVWLDVSGVLRIQMPWAWAHVADGALIFLVAYWLDMQGTFQLVIGILMNLIALFVAYRYWRFKQSAGLLLFFISLLFVFNGLVIGGAQTPLFGPFMRIDAFHLILAFWAWGSGIVLRQMELPLIGKSLP
jgi:hypothetical protein